MKTTLLYIFIGLLISGFLYSFYRVITLLCKVAFLKRYKHKYQFLLAEFDFKIGGLQNEEAYEWLLEKEAYFEDAITGNYKYELFLPQSDYKVKDYKLIRNTLPKFKTHILEKDANNIETYIVLNLGEQRKNLYSALLSIINPFKWLHYGLMVLFNIPFYIATITGLKGDSFFNKITGTSLFKIIAFVFNLFGWLVGVISGWDDVIRFIQNYSAFVSV